MINSSVIFIRKRCEYTVQEDMAILRFVLDKNLYDKVGGNTTWRLVARVSGKIMKIINFTF